MCESVIEDLAQGALFRFSCCALCSLNELAQRNPIGGVPSRYGTSTPQARTRPV